MKKELLYQVAKLIAESDSIGEGYGYCEEYTKKEFKTDIPNGPDTGNTTYRSLAEKIIKLVNSWK